MACGIFCCGVRAFLSLLSWCAGSRVCGLSCPTACGILVPWPAIEPMPPALEGRFLTTGPPGKSLYHHFYLRKRECSSQVLTLSCALGEPLATQEWLEHRPCFMWPLHQWRRRVQKSKPSHSHLPLPACDPTILLWVNSEVHSQSLRDSHKWEVKREAKLIQKWYILSPSDREVSCY